jgi:opacity protein-like surface antigen
MLTCFALRRHLALTGVALAALVVGTVTAAAAPEPKSGEYGGKTYGGATYGGSTYGTPTAVTPPPPAPEAAPPPMEEPPPPMEITEVSEPWYERWGLAIAAGGGVEGFTDENETGADVGENGNVRLSVGTRTPFTFEGSYIGSAQNIEALGLDTDTYLYGNGLQAAARVNFLQGYGVSVFALGGVAWRHYSLSSNDFNTSDVSDSDDVMEIPVGGGIAFGYSGFMFDARSEYRMASYGDLFDNNPQIERDPDLNRWNVQANIGYEF